MAGSPLFHRYPLRLSNHHRFFALLISFLVSFTASEAFAVDGDYGPNESVYWSGSGFENKGYPGKLDGNRDYYLDRCNNASTTEGPTYAYCRVDTYITNPGSPSPFWMVEVIGVKAQENCGTDTIPGAGHFDPADGPGIYGIGGCAYYCATNYSLLDGNTSFADARECTGQGSPATAPDGFISPSAGEQCRIEDATGECLDMDKQDGGSCPTGTTYGQVDGTDVCVPPYQNLSGVDSGTQGPEGQGGNEPDPNAPGGGDGGDGGDGGTDPGDGGGTCVPTEENDCSGQDGGDSSGEGQCTETDTSGCSDSNVTPPEIGENQFYTPKDKTANQVLNDFQSDVMATDIAQGVAGFFDVSISGSCPTWTIPGVWVFPPIPIDMQCSAAMNNVWPAIAAILIATCGFIAFRIAVL